jgi:hypothetical protein
MPNKPTEPGKQNDYSKPLKTWFALTSAATLRKGMVRRYFSGGKRQQEATRPLPPSPKKRLPTTIPPNLCITLHMHMQVRLDCLFALCFVFCHSVWLFVSAFCSSFPILSTNPSIFVSRLSLHFFFFFFAACLVGNIFDFRQTRPQPWAFIDRPLLDRDAVSWRAKLPSTKGRRAVWNRKDVG